MITINLIQASVSTQSRPASQSRIGGWQDFENGIMLQNILRLKVDCLPTTHNHQGACQPSAGRQLPTGRRGLVSSTT